MNNSRSYLNLVFTIAIYTLVFSIPTQGFAQAIVPGFNTNVLGPNDDGSTGEVSVGFDLNFFGVVRNTLYVNNNGNVTLDSALWTYTPFDLTSTGHQIIAPFFADVDTRAYSDSVSYGSGIFAGRPAFGVNWINVNCYYASTPRGNNSFQLILVDRSDVGLGDFDIVFNYDQILWETGQASGGSSQCLGGSSARAGFSNGTGDSGTFYELPGSGIPGAFLNGGPNALVTGRLNSSVSGRYIFQARNGNIPVPSSTAGIPTLHEWALLLMGLLLGGLVWHQSRRKGRMAA